MKKISVVIPVYNEAEGLEALHQRLSSVAEGAGDLRFEFILVNDGSRDATAAKLAELRQRDVRVEVISFARNSGSHSAIFAGLDRCTGDAAVVMAADLQDPPELIARLAERWRAGSRTVWAVRSGRSGESAWVTWPSRMYYTWMNRMLPFRLPPQGADVFLIDRSVIELVRGTPEKHTSVFLLVAWFGVAEDRIEYAKQARARGRSKWTLAKKVELLINSVFSFSPAPLAWVHKIGMACVFVSLCLLIGSQKILAAMFFLSGVQLTATALVGQFAWRAFEAARPRPRYVLLDSTLPPRDNLTP